VGGERRFPGWPPPGGGTILHRDSAPQRDGAAAHRPCAEQYVAGYSGPLRAHAWQGCVVAAGHGPCRHRNPAGRRAAAGRTPAEPRRDGPREISGRGLALERRIRWRDFTTIASPWRFG